jgi:magnesium transporter
MQTASIPELKFETANERRTRCVPIAFPTDKAGDLRQSLCGKRFDCVAEIAICDSAGSLVGLVNIEDLLAADRDTPVETIMDASPPSVAPNVDQELAAWRAIRHAESSLAVVDEQGRFQGLIPPRQIFEVLLIEHDEDTARLGGFLRNNSEATEAGFEPILRRLQHRLPWLFIGLIGALSAAKLIGMFEAKLQSHVILALFVPGIVYLADAVGTQTETVVIRGLSVGVAIENVFWREVSTGVLTGIIIAAIAFPLVHVRWGRADLATVVSMAILCACSVANSVALALPWLLRHLGQDPAFAAGPLATVIQDLLSVVIYLSICAVLI